MASKPHAPRRPVMIGAHVPKKPRTRAQRCSLAESAEMINRAYEERFVTKATRTHLVRGPAVPSHRS